jgi:hypothetical protein
MKSSDDCVKYVSELIGVGVEASDFLSSIDSSYHPSCFSPLRFRHPRIKMGLGSTSKVVTRHHHHSRASAAATRFHLRSCPLDQALVLAPGFVRGIVIDFRPISKCQTRDV